VCADAPYVLPFLLMRTIGNQVSDVACAGGHQVISGIDECRRGCRNLLLHRFAVRVRGPASSLALATRSAGRQRLWLGQCAASRPTTCPGTCTPVRWTAAPTVSTRRPRAAMRQMRPEEPEDVALGGTRRPQPSIRSDLWPDPLSADPAAGLLGCYSLMRSSGTSFAARPGYLSPMGDERMARSAL
jgi:hypothetical protein